MPSKKQSSNSRAKHNQHNCQITMGQLEKEARLNQGSTGNLFKQFWNETAADFLRSFEIRFRKELNESHNEAEELAHQALLLLMRRVSNHVVAGKTRNPNYSAFGFVWEVFFSKVFSTTLTNRFSDKQKFHDWMLSLEEDADGDQSYSKTVAAPREEEPSQLYEVYELQGSALQGLKDLYETSDQVDASILKMRCYDGLTQREIGEKLGYTQSHISGKLRKLLEKLKSSLEE